MVQCAVCSAEECAVWIDFAFPSLPLSTMAYDTIDPISLEKKKRITMDFLAVSSQSPQSSPRRPIESQWQSIWRLDDISQCPNEPCVFDARLRRCRVESHRSEWPNSRPTVGSDSGSDSGSVGSYGGSVGSDAGGGRHATLPYIQPELASFPR
mmetsp:Transcript_31041/g.63522  ORF Transcript_31041/g.63522 Transcript_31041/m.63522 type:complete len:153 (-) Transcript_31041:55-513(-)